MTDNETVRFDDAEPWNEIAELDSPAADRMGGLLVPVSPWSRTTIDLDAMPADPRQRIHALCAGIVFCLLELVQDVIEAEKRDRFEASLRFFCRSFSRFAPALCGTDHVNEAGVRELHGLSFQARSFLGWLAEGVPVVAAKVEDLDKTLGMFVQTLTDFMEV